MSRARGRDRWMERGQRGETGTSKSRRHPDRGQRSRQRQGETRSPLTLHIEGDEDLSGASGAAGVADVLARVLLCGAGDDQAAVHHPVLPGQRRPQLRPLDPGRWLSCRHVTVRHPRQGGSGQVHPYPRPPSPPHTCG